MIVTAPYRSAGTTYANMIAKETGNIFRGEVYYNSMEFTSVFNKNNFHEWKNQPSHTVRDINILFENNDNSVILNNWNPALFSQSHHFIVRDNLLRSYESLFGVFSSTTDCNQMDILSWGSFKHTIARMTYFTALMYDYMDMNGIKPIVLERQPWYKESDKKYDLLPEIIESLTAHSHFCNKFRNF